MLILNNYINRLFCISLIIKKLYICNCPSIVRQFMNGETLRVINPATEDLIAELNVMKKEEVRQVIDDAYEAYLKWSQTPLRDRIKILHRIADLLEMERDDVVKVLVSESGKPIRDAYIELDRAISIIRSSAEEARSVLEGSAPRVDGLDYPVGNENRLVVEIREPIGVVGVAQSYNNPASTFAHKTAPIIATGNTAVVKPSRYTPLTALRLLNIYQRAGVPRGVVGVVIGSGEEVFDELITSKKVAGISFTGSTAVGLQVASKAASYGKKFMIAPSGSDPMIVFSDANLALAVSVGVRARFENAGQNCNATKRIFVEEGIYEKFLEEYVKLVKEIRVGDPMNMETDMGPLISDKMVKSMESVVQDAVNKGGRVLIGGKRIPRIGYFFEPTVIEMREPNLEAKVLSEEVFGPVVPIVPFRTEDEAVELANSSPYGLQASVFTNDYRRAFRVARRIRAGSVMINDSTRVRFDLLPYGGVKMSGFGWREGVRSTMYFFTEPKYYVINTG